MGGITFNEIVGQMLKHGAGYGPVFAIASSLHVAGFLLVLLTIRKVQPLDVPTAPDRVGALAEETP